MQTTKLISWALCLLLSGISAGAYALSSDVEKPVTIESDSAVFDKTAGTATYTGNVIIHQGTLEILAANIQITAPGNEIQNIVAIGSPVSFKQEMDGGKQTQGKANEMQYFVKEKRLTLQGNAELTQDKDVFTSNHIEYLPENGQLKAGGEGKKAGRVSATFYPTNKAK
jgi:lipopolysaccharide export system protein LptA